LNDAGQKLAHALAEELADIVDEIVKSGTAKGESDV